MDKASNRFIDLYPETSDFLASELKFLIGDTWRSAKDGRTFTTLNPSTGEALAEVPRGSAADVDCAVNAARQAFEAGAWLHQLTPSERGQLLWRLADLIEAHSEVLAQLDALDNGKPVSTVRTVDIPYAVEHFRYFAGWTNKLEGSTLPVNASGMLNYTLREPLGVCGLIVPWNYPLLMAVWKIAPALAAGNCIILKPAEQTPLSALYLGRLFQEAGFPSGVFNVLTGFGSEVGAAMTAHMGIDKIGFTGSTETARHILQAATGNLKRVSLELGGKSPNIIFADADLPQAINGATWAIFGNNGQSCTAGSRLYIERKIFEDVLEGMSEAVKTIKVGQGMAVEQPNLGPVVSEQQLARVLGYIDEGIKAGAEPIIGGSRILGDLAEGYFIEPSIFINATDDMKIAREEIFGPVVCAMPFDDPDEILQRANDSDYGLAAGLWTNDLRKAHHFAAKLKAGTVWINTWGNTEAASPFGGYKQSGYGREMGRQAVELYSDLKSVWVKYG